MLGTVNGLVAQAPCPASEADDEKEEEDAYHLEENDVSHSAERAEKPAHAASDASSGAASGATGSSRRCRAGHRIND